MKKIYYLFAAVGAAGLMSCTQKTSTEVSEAQETPAAPAYPAYYEGIVPGADVAEISYGVAIVPFADGDTAVYTMCTEYVGAPAPGNVVADKGAVSISKGTPTDESATVYALIPVGAESPAYYFIATDSTLVMVGENLEPAASGLNYTLTRRM